MGKEFKGWYVPLLEIRRRVFPNPFRSSGVFSASPPQRAWKDPSP